MGLPAGHFRVRGPKSGINPTPISTLPARLVFWESRLVRSSLRFQRVAPIGLAFITIPLMLATMRFGLIPLDQGVAQPARPTDSIAAPQATTLASPPLSLANGEKVAFLGNSLAERFNLDGHFETWLHLRFPQSELRVRNFAWPADEVGQRQRPNDYTKIDDPVAVFRADTYLCFFGFNESFAGDDPEALANFESTYDRFLDDFAAQYPRADHQGPPRFVLVSPVAFEVSGDPYLPSGVEENRRLAAYTQAIQRVAARRGLLFVDLFTPTQERFQHGQGLRYTVNGCHLNTEGNRLVSRLLDQALFGSPHPRADLAGTALFERLRAEVIDKAWYHQQDYRMLNGWYVYGGRRTWDTETFPREYVKIRNMVAVRDRRIFDLVQGRPISPIPDDSRTGELYVPPTRFGDPRQKYSEAEELRYLTPLEFKAVTAVAEGLELKLFADETRFPELANPVQLNFDAKGRLWVACMPTYPQWKPGDPKPSDRLLIFEDDDKDGVADRVKVFYDKLHCPTGFEFWNGGVLVVDQPRVLFLKDNDGDDRADQVEFLMDGWATDDTHHTCGAWEWSHGGLLHMLEGIATSTTLETPRGPHRSFGSGGAYVFDPRTWVIRQFTLPGQYNSWCYVFDQWGQGIVGDGTTANHHWDSPLSTAWTNNRKGLDTIFNNEGMRPALGNEILVSRHLPDDLQGQITYACVINMNGMPRFTLEDDGAGFRGQRLKKADGSPDDLIRSTDKHFRPGDPQIGPDGAVWFVDWANALIGHMQYSQRDPNRDKQRGRIYRLVAKDRPLIEPTTQDGKTIPELLEQLRAPEWRTRYRARRALRDFAADAVANAVDSWVRTLNPDNPEFDRLRCEALWALQSHHRVKFDLLEQVATSAKLGQARAAAIRVLADERTYLDPERSFTVLARAVRDEHPRVRLEAVRALSFLPESRAVEAILEAAAQPLDKWLSYTIEHALSANEPVWRTAYYNGTLAADNPQGLAALNEVMAAHKAGLEASRHLRLLLSSANALEVTPEVRDKAYNALATLEGGNPTKGREIFVRNCTACHKVGNGEGQEYGPNLAKVAERLSRQKLVESIIDPNAEVADDYLTTAVEVEDGRVVSGLRIPSSDQEVIIFNGKDKVVIPKTEVVEILQVKQSSMPEGLAGAMSPTEFLDLIEYLSRLK